MGRGMVGSFDAYAAHPWGHIRAHAPVALARVADVRKREGAGNRVAVGLCRPGRVILPRHLGRGAPRLARSG